MSSDILTLESFLLTEDKEEFLSKLVEGTDSFYFFTLTHAMNQKGGKLNKKELEYLQIFRRDQ